MVQAKSEQERRNEARVEVGAGEVTGEFTSLADFLDFFAINISEGGMKVESEHYFPEGSTFHFKMDLGERDEPFEGMGSVRWVNRTPNAKGLCEMGVQFAHLTPPSKQLVELIVRTHQREGT